MWVLLLEPVTERVGVWALVRDYPRRPQAVAAVRDLRRAVNGRPSRATARLRIPAGRWEFTQSPIDGSDLFGVWAKYLGRQGDEA